MKKNSSFYQSKFTAATRRFYDRMGAWHERLRKEEVIDQEILPRLFRLLPKDLSGRVAVDAGGGTGTFSKLLLQRNAKRVILIDISPKMLAVARALKRRQKLRRLFIRQGTLLKTGLPGHSADVVMAIYSLPYIIDVDAAFREFARILKPGGSLYIASDFYALKDERLAGTPIRYILGNIKMTGVVHRRKDYLGAARRNGLTIVRFFATCAAKGLAVDPRYRYKNKVKQHTFGAVWKMK